MIKYSDLPPWITGLIQEQCEECGNVITVAGGNKRDYRGIEDVFVRCKCGNFVRFSIYTG